MIDAIHPRRTRTLWTTPLKIDEAARELGLTDDRVEALMTLRKLRNSVAHSAETRITWEDANRFKQSTERLLSRMCRTEPVLSLVERLSGGWQEAPRR